VERGLLLTTGASEPTCGCTTIYTTITGEGTSMLNLLFQYRDSSIYV
jgi:hypothetical protein